MSFKLAEAFVELQLDDEKLRAGLAQLQGLTDLLDRSFESLLQRSESVGNILAQTSGLKPPPSPSPPIDLPGEAAGEFSADTLATAADTRELPEPDAALPADELSASGTFRSDTPIPSPDPQVPGLSPWQPPPHEPPPSFAQPAGPPPAATTTFDAIDDQQPPPPFASPDGFDRPALPLPEHAPPGFELPEVSERIERALRDAIGLLQPVESPPAPTPVHEAVARDVDATPSTSVPVAPPPTDEELPHRVFASSPLGADLAALLASRPHDTTTAATSAEREHSTLQPQPSASPSQAPAPNWLFDDEADRDVADDLAALRRAVDDQSLLDPLLNRLDDWADGQHQQAEQSNEDLSKLLELASDTNTTVHRLENRDEGAVFS